MKIQMAQSLVPGTRENAAVRYKPLNSGTNEIQNSSRENIRDAKLARVLRRERVSAIPHILQTSLSTHAKVMLTKKDERAFCAAWKGIWGRNFCIFVQHTVSLYVFFC